MKLSKTLPLVGVCLAATLGAEAKKTQPNVIVIMVDDMGYGDFGCYGNKYHKTPNVDMLAQKGARFTDFHSNGAVSSPTRASFITGRYQQFVGIDDVVSAASHRHVGLDTSHTSIAKLHKKNGYSTAIYGKWHLGYDEKYNPINHGFDEFVGFVSGNVDYFSHIDMANYKDWWKNDKKFEEEGYTTDIIARYAVEYINEHKNNPFFLYLPFEATHSPYQAPEDGPVRGTNAQPVKNKRPPRETYKLMVESMDGAVGQIMDAVKANKLDNNTLVIFFSDNGGAKYSTNAPLSGKKSNVLEGGHRVSCVAYYPPAIKPGTVINQTAMSMDMLSTICEFTKTSTKGVVSDGVSLWPLLTKGTPLKDRTLFWKTSTDIAVRKGDWKLSINYRDYKSKKMFPREGITGQLVNLKDDLKEKVNLWDQKPELVKELLDEIVAWEKSYAHVEQLSALDVPDPLAKSKRNRNKNK